MAAARTRRGAEVTHGFGHAALKASHIYFPSLWRDNMKDQMTAKERDALRETVRLRARVAKADVDKRGAALRAEVERQLSATFQADDAAWSAAVAAAEAALKSANETIQVRCRELGIRPEFAPRVSGYWRERGENALPSRRAELRALAGARIEASVKEAKLSVERWQAGAQEQLLAGLLTSESAQQFLGQLPSAEALLPPLSLAQIEGFAQSPSLRIAREDPLL